MTSTVLSLRSRETNLRTFLYLGDVPSLDEILAQVGLSEHGESTRETLQRTIEWFESLDSNNACLLSHINAYWVGKVLCEDSHWQNENNKFLNA